MRRTGNNYSGARWAFSAGRQEARMARHCELHATEHPEGFTHEAVANRITDGELVRDGATPDMLEKYQKHCVVCGNGMLVWPWGERVPPDKVATVAVAGESYSVHAPCVKSFDLGDLENADQEGAEQQAFQHARNNGDRFRCATCGGAARLELLDAGIRRRIHVNPLGAPLFNTGHQPLLIPDR
jgi:hypothetical protein